MRVQIHLNICPRLAKVGEEPKYVLDLVWADHADNETGFVIERSEDDVVWTPVGLGPNGTTTSANINEYTDETAEAGKQYHYRVKAVSGALESSYCEKVTVSLPQLLADINVDSNNDGSITETDDLIEADAAAQRRKRLATHPHLVVEGIFIWSDVKRHIGQIISTCTDVTWEASVAQLSRFFQWEYAYYKNERDKET